MVHRHERSMLEYDKRTTAGRGTSQIPWIEKYFCAVFVVMDADIERTVIRDIHFLCDVRGMLRIILLFSLGFVGPLKPKQGSSIRLHYDETMIYIWRSWTFHSLGVGDRMRTHRVFGGRTQSVGCPPCAEEGPRSVMRK